jgi:hypothetical protein
MNIIYQYQTTAKKMQSKAFICYENNNDVDGDKYASKAQSLYIHAHNMLEALKEGGRDLAITYHVLNCR